MERRDRGRRRIGKYPWYYQFPLSSGPLLLLLSGAAMIVFALLGTQPESVAIATMTLGVALLLAGTVAPRMKGDFRLSPRGIQGQLADLDEFLEEGYVAVALPPKEGDGAASHNGDGKRKRLPYKGMQEILDEATKQGWEVRRERHHFVLHGPKGQRAAVPLSPRSPERIVDVLRRIGLDLPQSRNI